MKRVLCVWLPNWPRQRPKGAREHELTDREALKRLVAWCEQFSPTVGLESSPAPECLLFDVTGLAPLFHGEAALIEHVAREFRRRGYTVRLALADTLGAAWAVAHYGLQKTGTLTSSAMEFRYIADEATILPPGHGLAALASLPLEALRLTPETVRTLRELGLVRIGQLTSLPRAGLATRFGAELLLRLDQAAGEVAEVSEVHHPPPEAQANWTFEPPTDRHDLIDWALGRLVERVVDQLAGRRGVQQLECRMRGQTTAHAQFSVGLFRPSATPRHLEELVKLRLETHPLAEPVAGLELSVTATAPLEERQRELFAGAAGVTAQRIGDDSRALALLIDRLSNRLGREAVVRARLLSDAQPEFAWRYEPAITNSERRARNAERRNKRRVLRNVEIAPHRGTRAAGRLPVPRLSLSRPLCLLPEPLPLVVVSIVPDGPPLVFTSGGVEWRIERTWGPERIQTGWWRAPSVARDYYRVETATGQWFWLFRQLTDGRWFLHGVFE
jgi:protein ImuB